VRLLLWGCNQARNVNVREMIQRLEQAGWLLVATRGSHRQFKHPKRPGRVTVAEKPSDDLAPGTLKSIAKQSRVSLP
jgi:predicted RNA binding protein YcfA (HicA-like mRNA interferase family)